jgi:hypothetical protein
MLRYCLFSLLLFVSLLLLFTLLMLWLPYCFWRPERAFVLATTCIPPACSWGVTAVAIAVVPSVAGFPAVVCVPL